MKTELEIALPKLVEMSQREAIDKAYLKYKRAVQRTIAKHKRQTEKAK